MVPKPPGASVPPAATVTGPLRMPVPPKVAPVATITRLVPVMPLTSRVPLLTVVRPVYVFVLASVRVPGPVLVSAALPAIALPEMV